MTDRRPATVVVILVTAAVVVALAVMVLRRDAPSSGGDASGATSAAVDAGGGSPSGDADAEAIAPGQATPPAAGLPAPESSALTETWSGTLSILEPAESVGSLEVTLVRQGSVVTGSLTTNASSCFSNGGIQGVIDGAAVEFSLLQRDEVEFEGETTGETMSGTVSVACDDSQGSWTMTRQP